MGEVRFSTQAVGFVVKDGQLSALRLRTPSGEEVLECSQVILAVGHSARDTFETLYSMGLPMEAKAFSVAPGLSILPLSLTRPSTGSSRGTPLWVRRITSFPAIWKAAGAFTPFVCALAGMSPGRPRRKGAW